MLDLIIKTLERGAAKDRTANNLVALAQLYHRSGKESNMFFEFLVSALREQKGNTALMQLYAGAHGAQCATERPVWFTDDEIAEVNNIPYDKKTGLPVSLTKEIEGVKRLFHLAPPGEFFLMPSLFATGRDRTSLAGALQINPEALYLQPPVRFELPGGYFGEALFTGVRRPDKHFDYEEATEKATVNGGRLPFAIEMEYFNLLVIDTADRSEGDLYTALWGLCGLPIIQRHWEVMADRVEGGLLLYTSTNGCPGVMTGPNTVGACRTILPIRPGLQYNLSLHDIRFEGGHGWNTPVRSYKLPGE